MLYLTSKDMVRTLLTRYFEPFRTVFLRMLLNSDFLLYIWAPLIWRKLVLGSNQRSPAYLSYPGRLGEPITRETKSWRGQSSDPPCWITLLWQGRPPCRASGQLAQGKTIRAFTRAVGSDKMVNFSVLIQTLAKVDSAETLLPATSFLYISGT